MNGLAALSYLFLAAGFGQNKLDIYKTGFHLDLVWCDKTTHFASCSFKSTLRVV